MADYLLWAGKLFSNVKGFYSEMNPATLSGANDVIIIRQEDGTFKTSPWDIRFGKMGVFWANENNVDVEINGKLVNLPMKLGTAGEAIFAGNFENHAMESSFREEPNLPDNVENTCPTSEDLETVKEDLEIISTDHAQQLTFEEPEDEAMIPLSKMRCNSLPEISLEDLNLPVETEALSDNNSDVGMDSGAEDDPGCIVGSLPSRPNEFLSSLKHLKYSQNVNDMNWQWDPLTHPSDNRNNNISNIITAQAAENKEGPVKKDASSNQNKGKVEGIYLEQLMEEPELISIYIYPKSDEVPNKVRDHPKDVDSRSDPGVPHCPFSAPHSPVPFDEDLKSRTRAMSFSSSETETLSSSRPMLESQDPNMQKVQQQSEPASTVASLSQIDISLCGGLEDLHESALQEKFEQNKVSFKQFISNPSLLNDPSLVVRIGGKFFKWAIASSMIISLLVFQEPLPDETRESLMKQHMPQKSTSQKRRWLGGWFGGREKETTDRSSHLAIEGASDTDYPGLTAATEVLSSDHSKPLAEVNASAADSLSQQDLSSGEKLSEEQQTAASNSSTAASTRKPTEAKGLTLTAKQIELMNIHEGRNEATFSITTKYQGTTKCYCSVFLWNWFDRIVISDIDGTITKSDVLGQVLPIISSTWIWSQVGIANLYTLIHQNGYKFIYLSARAIGQAKLTRDYLRSVKQGEYLLPDGPLLLSPSSLRNAFHKEVIERKPEEFKIKCLRDILSLFPPSIANPFMAGFGNRVNDVFAYNTVGIPKERIFIVNTKGQLRIEKSTTFSSTYSKLSDIVDQIFPPVAVDPEYSSFNYWRDTSQSISEDEALQFLGVGKNKRGRRLERAATTPGGASLASK